MKGKGPLLTLLGGLLVAVVLIGLSMRAATKKTAAPTAGAAPGASVPATVASPATPRVTSVSPSAAKKATYAGRVDGGGATIAIAVHDGVVISYVCDGRQTEAWLRGTAHGGTLRLTGSTGARLTGTFDSRWAGGTVWAAGKKWSFRVPAVTPPSGAYRANANVAGARVVAGWIRLPDGTVVGTYTIDGANPAPAPPLDPATGAAAINGAAVTPAPLDPADGTSS